MELIQYKGPFYNGQYIKVPSKIGTTYVHIGIQIVRPEPSFIRKMVYNDDHTKYEYIDDFREIHSKNVVSINGINYSLNQNGILEFDDLGEIGWEIKFLTNLPPETIIDIIVDEQ